MQRGIPSRPAAAKASLLFLTFPTFSVSALQSHHRSYLLTGFSSLIERGTAALWCRLKHDNPVDETDPSSGFAFSNWNQ